MKWAARVFTAAIFALAILLAGLVVFSRTPTPPGEMVDVGGTRFRIDCSGPQHAALPTVIIESGASGLGLYYYWLQQELSQQVRTCSYDRAGTSWSDDNDEPHDAQHFSKQLHALLQKAGVKPPYVLAGHSLGGIIIRVYAGDYPSDVTGLVFLDSSHPDQVAKLPKPDGPAGSIETALLVQKLIQYAATVGLTHLYNPSAEALRSNEAFAALPRERQDLLIALTHRPQNYKGMREEYAGLEESFRQGGLVRTLG
ncbi:MAG: alpha/beta hydrolase, partial [Rhodospirillales bacterium]|nr:alpha/beta hydrolase [Rhodospirillales bacterium]